MARFKDINYLEFGKYIRELIADKKKIKKIQSGAIDIKEELKGFMTPRDVSWDDITIIPHFDKANEVNISFPFTGDVEASVKALAPATGAGEEYTFPDHYKTDPNAGATPKQRKENRLRAYQSRIGDYVMARCK